MAPKQGVTKLGLLGSATNGNQTGQSVKVTYSDGSTQGLTADFGDWCSTSSPPGAETVIATAYRNQNGSQGVPCRVYLDTLTGLNSTKTVASDTLPSNGNVHVFALAMDGKFIPQLAWTQPAAITYGTALSGSQLNATATIGGTPADTVAVPGTFAYSPAAGTVLDAGSSQPLSATFTPSDTLNYTGGTVSTTITVNKANQNISFGSLPNTSFGVAPFTVSATADSGLPVSFSATGNCSSDGANGATITVTGTGSCTVTASQAGNGDYNPATPLQQTFTISNGAANISLDSGSLSQTYDASPKPVTATTVPSGLTYSVTYDGSSIAPTAAGSYSVTATITDPNYQGSATGTLDVAPYTPVLTWNQPADIVYGTPLGSSQLDAKSDSPGSFAYSPPSGTMLNAGTSQTLSGNLHAF